MGKEKPKQQIAEYYMSLHYGICHGPIDYISQIRVKEKVAWSGEARSKQALIIEKKHLFGGPSKEGGVRGSAYYLPGDSEQTIPEFLAAKVGLTTATMPAYRGITSLWMTEVEANTDGRTGFYWSANTPFIPPTWVKIARASIGLTDSIARIYRGGSTLIGTEVNLGGGRTGNRSYKWDTNGDWAAWGEHGSGIQIFDLPAGTARVVAAGSGSTVHITDTGKIVTYSASAVGIQIHDAATGNLLQTITVGGGTPFAYDIFVDDITIGSDNYIIGFGAQYFVLKSTGGSYSVEWEHTVDLDAGPDVSAGQTFAYFVEGDFFVGAESIIRVGIEEYSETLITPPELTAYIAACHYDNATDSVIIACENGDLFKYSPDLSTLLASKTGNGFTLSKDGLLGKRMSIANGLVAFFVQGGGGDAGNIHIFSTSDLSLDRIFVGEDAGENGFSQAEPAFVGFNPDQGMVFLPAHFGNSYLWFILGTGEFDSNPSHIIYECLTNTDWGMGSASSAIDVASFEAAAQVLYDEGFGLSLQWTKQSTIESFISEIIDHIEATIFVNPRTGLITIKLIRNDYSLTDLLTYTPDNSEVTKFGRKLWGETNNEIIVSFTNPDNEESETVVAQDLANITVQGGIVSDSRNYYGVRVKSLAARLAQRDLRTSAYPLATCDIEVDREGWDLLPGGVLILNSPEDGINVMVMRVGTVDYGKPGDPTVRASLMEDVFSLAAADYTVPPDTGGDDEDEEPAPAANTYIQTLPYFLVVNTVDAAVLSGVEYPEAFAGVFASQQGEDSVQFELHEAGEEETIGTKSIAVRATLPDDIDAEVETIILSFPDRSSGEGPIVGGFMLIGEGDEDTIELCYINGFTSAGYEFTRGVLDTTPKDWPAGTPVWFLNEDMTVVDFEIRSAAEEVTYQILTLTPLGLLDLNDAPEVSETLTERPHLPSRPAKVAVNGTYFETVNLVGVDPIPITWANRNRLTEDAVVLWWDAATVTPEAGQTTKIYLLRLDYSVITSFAGLSGTSYNLDPSEFGAETDGYIAVYSERGGLESLQGHSIRVFLEATADTDVFALETGDALLLETGDNLLLEDYSSFPSGDQPYGWTGAPFDEIAFSDDFDGVALDSSKWGNNWLGSPGAITTPPEAPSVYTAATAACDPARLSISGGELTISAVANPVTIGGHEFANRTGCITSNGKFNYTYGYVEARAWFDGTAGVIDNWPALWTNGQGPWPTNGENDYAEGLGGALKSNYHTGNSPGVDNPAGTQTYPGDCTGWHIIGTLWESGSIKYYFDGVLVRTITANIKSAPHYLVINYSIGGAGGPVDLSSVFKVDYIRVWQNN